MTINIGSEQMLARDIIGSATEDHPAFLLGKKGEKVKVIGYIAKADSYPYLVKGPTNQGKVWRACSSDFVTI